jgi:3-oxoacid CoA-transferase B subunit
MDLCAGARQLFIAMEHTTRDGDYKIVKELSYPATAASRVSKLFTNLAVITITPKGMVLNEIFAGITPEDVQACTEPELIISPDLKEISF